MKIEYLIKFRNEIIEKSSFQQFSPPTIFRIGAAADPVFNQKNHIIISFQLNHPVDNAEYIVSGIEYSYLETFFLRGGYKFNKNEENYSFGVGVKMSFQDLGLALITVTLIFNIYLIQKDSA